MIRRIIAIARNTFRESVRNKILYTLLFFAVGMIAFAVLIASLALGDFTKIVRSMGLTSINLIGVAIAIFVGTRLVVQEIEQRTIFTVLSKPVRRWEFVVGKFAGLAVLLFFEIALLGAAYIAVVWLANANPNPSLVVALVGIYIECLVVVGISLFFSAFTSPVLAVGFVIGSWIIARLAASLRDLAAQSDSALVATLGKSIAGVIPNLQYLDFAHPAVHNLPLDPVFVVQSLLNGLGWALLFVAAACVVFERRAFDK